MERLPWSELQGGSAMLSGRAWGHAPSRAFADPCQGSANRTVRRRRVGGKNQPADPGRQQDFDRELLNEAGVINAEALEWAPGDLQGDFAKLSKGLCNLV